MHSKKEYTGAEQVVCKFAHVAYCTARAWRKFEQVDMASKVRRELRCRQIVKKLTIAEV